MSAQCPRCGCGSRFGGEVVWCSQCGWLDQPAASSSSEPEADSESERPTYRERREARADRLRGWADSREAKAESATARAREMGDAIPFGQPVMGARDARYRERMRDTYGRGYEHARKAESMRARADSIEAQAAAAIYSDDPDACEQLAAKIARLEAERDRWKSYNAACRKAKESTAEAVALLDDAQRRELVSCARAGSAFLGKHGSAPAFILSNLTANIGRLRKRLLELERAGSSG